MATTLYMRNTTTNGIGTYTFDMLPTAGSGNVLGKGTSVSGGTEIQFKDNSQVNVIEWVSGRSPSGGWTLAGSVTFNIYALEVSMSANVGGRARLFKRTSSGTVTEISGGPFNDGVEFGTTPADMTWTGTPTSTAFSEDDRLIVRFYGTNIGTMGDGHIFQMEYNAATNNSYITLTENVTFKAESGSPYTLVADSGSYTITGATASLYTGRKLDAASGSYSVTGADTGMYVGRKLSADPGAYSVTGADAGLITSRILNAEAGSYTVTGFDATMGRLFTMNAEPGSYAITGADAGFVRSYLLQADAGAYTVTGSDAGLLSARTLSADAGSYTLTGADGSLRRGYLLQTEPGAYVVVGAAGTMQAHRIMEAGPGSYSITGIAAELIYTPIGAYVLVAEPGSYTVGGADASLLSGRTLSADAGVYSISGVSAELVYTANTARDYIVFARHRGRR